MRKNKEKKPRKSMKESFLATREKIWDKKRARLKLHHSFHRSYREDYNRGLKTPGLVAHAMSTMKILFKNWKLFGGLLIIIVLMNVICVGLMSESSYTTTQDAIDESSELLNYGEVGRVAKSAVLLVMNITTGGLTKDMTDIQPALVFFFTAVTLLVTIYYLRHLLAGNHPRIRDGLYNALAPLISVMLTIGLIFIHLIPVFIFVILYSTAVQTEFLTEPLYAFLFWLLGGLLILLSAYLLPVSILSLMAVTVPGIYPMQAMNAVTDLIQGRRTKFIIRIAFGILFLAVIWVVVMLPIIWLDLVLKQNVEWLEGIAIVPFFFQVMTTFTVIYASAYVYLFYRRMLDDPE
ncbi:hypothetical protein IKQ65_03590 [Candidatus Saccharibacteria bacterium]|nr:hypothetical protein [Candidatus Saccharibacteria bacterium]MBR6961616.1 hypothetical protein [Candidatus Saccharibacteria bacterium]